MNYNFLEIITYILHFQKSALQFIRNIYLVNTHYWVISCIQYFKSCFIVYTEPKNDLNHIFTF
ncbi:MAG: hypothetical protein RLZZ420_1429 [Bacteroidota bacterium]|jgi:hypothetical protein